MFIALVVIHVLTSIILVLVVLLQSGRGAELGAAFGGVGQSQFGRTQSTFISKLTTGLAVVFMATSLGLSLVAGERPTESLLQPGAVTAPAPAVPAASTPAPASATGTAQGPAAAPTLPQTEAPKPDAGKK
jgi:preprotein translocase subunit SecG